MVIIAVRDQQLPASRLAARDYIPEHSSGPALLWVHGGGFAGGSIDMPESDAVARWIADAGLRVRTVDYRLAPAWPDDGPISLHPAPGRFPAAQDDVIAAFLDLLEQGPAFLGGASAGACIAASAAVRMRDEGGPRPLGLALVYGIFHSRLPASPSTRTSEVDGSRQTPDAERDEWVARMTLNYAGSVERLSDPRAFPGEGNLRGLPDTLILDADCDSLRASGRRFAEQLRAAAVPTVERVLPYSEHGFLNKPAGPHFEQGVTEMTRWMRQVGRMAGVDAR